MNKIITYLILLLTSVIFAQNKDKNLYDGVKAFEEKQYISAETDFRISQSKNEQEKATADYNLGNSIYRQNNPGEAKYKFYNAVETAKTKEQKHKAYHNLGNALMKEENYQGAVAAYKNALRNNPLDDETRYNYALAKQKLKENPPQGDKDKDKKGGDKNQDQQNQQNQKDKDKGENNDKQDKDQDKKDSDKGDQKDKNKDGKDKQDKGEGNDKEEEKPQPKPSSANKQQIENLLDAVENAEKKIQDKVNAKKVKVQPATNDKDW